MRKPLISLGLWTLGLGSAAAAACSSPDPGVNYAATSPTSFSAQDSGSGSAVSNPGSGMSNDAGSAPAPTSGTDAGGTVTSTDAGDATHVSAEAGEGGSGGGGDGGALAGFLGETAAWATNLPTPTAFQAHTTAGQAQQTPQLDCLLCHGAAGPGSPFLAAGFVATAPNGTTGAADVEVRVYAAGGAANGYSAHTDANGYFWINPPVAGTTGPYSAGLRSKTTTTLMPVTQTMTDCQSSSCHGGATPGVLHSP